MDEQLLAIAVHAIRDAKDCLPPGQAWAGVAEVQEVLAIYLKRYDPEFNETAFHNACNGKESA